MQRTKTELYSLISDLKTKKDFEKEIKTRSKGFDGLVDADTIAYLLVDELGRNTHSITKIADLQPDKDFTVEGTVCRISDSKTFTRKNGQPGKVVNLEIVDETGVCKIVLWNGDIDQIKYKDIHQGTVVKIINGYAKQGYTGGMEINLGRWGLLEVKPPVDSVMKEHQESDSSDITGVLVKKEATKAFFKDDGEFGFVTRIMINEQGKEKEITLWDHCVKDIQTFSVGEMITLKNITMKNNNGKTVHHMNGASTIQKHMKKTESVVSKKK